MHEADPDYKLTWGDYAAMVSALIFAAEVCYLAAVYG
jgi:hypothetical protein